MPMLDYPIRVPSDMLEALAAFTGQFWSDSLALEPFVCEAIRNYIQQAPATPAAPAQPASPSQIGYQWKQLFLPEGTRLRASFHGRNYFARVDGDEIKYGEQAISPSRFANLQGSGNRNAWKAIWLCLPGSDEWLLAQVCRTVRKAAIARLLGNSMPTGHAQPKSERQRHQNAPDYIASGRRSASAILTNEAVRMDNDPRLQKSSSGRINRRKHRAMKRVAGS